MTPRLDHILEGVLLAAGEPMSIERLEAVFEEGERPGRRTLREALERLDQRLEESALMLEESASGFRLRVRDALSPWVSRLWEERPQRYSRALLETLALIAYRQPVTRADIEEVRGVSVSASIMRTLVERGWVRVIGHRDVPGRPAVYATTRSFLDDFGLRTLDALPPMSAVREGETADWLEQLSPQAQPAGSDSEQEPQGAAGGDSAAEASAAADVPQQHDGAATAEQSSEDPHGEDQDSEGQDSEGNGEAATPAQDGSDLRGIGDRFEARLRRGEQAPDEGDGSTTPPNEPAD